MLEKITRFDQKVKILCVLLSHESLSKKYTTYKFTYVKYYFFSRQVQKSKNYQNPTSASKVISKTSLNFWIIYVLFVIHLNLK